MTTIDKAVILQQFNWRYAAKHFDPIRKLKNEDWEFLVETLRLSPSSYGIQPWKFIWVESMEVRKKMTKASWGQPQVEECSHFVVLTSLTQLSQEYMRKYMNLVSETRGIPTEELRGYFDVVTKNLTEDLAPHEFKPWAQRQCYIAMGNLMTAAALVGIDTCPMEGLDAKEYDRLLDLEGTNYSTVAAVAVGYRSPEDRSQLLPKVRFPSSDILAKV